MKPLNTRIHGVLDYVVGIVLIVAPFLFGFNDNGPAMWTPIIIGAAVLLYSLMTDYEHGLARIIPMPVHLVLDGLGGAVLLASPWLFGFDDVIWWPHVLFGVLEIGIALLSQTRPSVEHHRHGPPILR